MWNKIQQDTNEDGVAKVCMSRVKRIAIFGVFSLPVGKKKIACLASLGNCAFNQLVYIYLKGREVSKYF